MGEFSGGPVVRTRVQSLVGELKSHKPHSMAKKKKKRLLMVKPVGSSCIFGQLPMLNHKTEGSDDIEVDVEEMAWVWSGSRW